MDVPTETVQGRQVYLDDTHDDGDVVKRRYFIVSDGCQVTLRLSPYRAPTRRELEEAVATASSRGTS